MKKTMFTLLIAAGMMNLSQAQNVGMNDVDDDLEDTGIVGVSDWESFNTLSEHVYMLEGKTLNETMVIIPQMRENIMLLDDTLPMWMWTESVMEDVQDVQKEYIELMKGTKMDTSEFKENLEEVIEQYEDLREEVGETVKKYNDIQAEAREEYMEEIENNRTRRQNMIEASKEYEEEIKELNEVTDMKK
ncbi:hypothetical protein [Nonlabens xiamenensis]|uniref:hypothetical protein n=1 Tax=Nonlabens xiamenensis TaxID=2341043 RepID=UPI000F607D74|nr:hypothetical protein [Nonlabens xiamenensis]